MPKRLFSSPRYLQQRTELITPSKHSKSRPEWVMSRGLCYYRLFLLSDIPIARRAHVLQLKIKQWSPFTEYGNYNVWQGGQVQVWIWDKQQQQKLLNEVGLKKTYIMPETVLRERPSTLDLSIRLIECLEGVEGQVWKEGILIGSHWWPEIPSPLEWEHFQRAHRLPVTPTVASAVQAPLLERPWGRHKAVGGNRLASYEKTGVIIGIAIFTVLLSWQLATVYKFKQSLLQIQWDINELSEKITPVLTHRNQTLDDKQKIERLLRLSPFPSQLELITQVAEKLPQDAKLISWIYAQGNLNFTIETPQPNPTFYVKTFQGINGFKEVNAQTGSGKEINQIVISLRIEQ